MPVARKAGARIHLLIDHAKVFVDIAVFHEVQGGLLALTDLHFGAGP